MRKEPYSIGSIVHVIKRGARGMPIIREDNDKWRFLKLLYYLNDYAKPENWEGQIFDIQDGLHFKRPNHWMERQPIVNILSYCLMPNHFHLLLEEINENGVSRFMQGLCGSMSLHFNGKYNEKGSLFQGAYKLKTINSDNYLNVVHVYINVKNPFELYEGGLEAAINNFEDAYQKAQEYNFCSLGDYSENRKGSPIVKKHNLYQYTSGEYKQLAKEMMLLKLEHLTELDLS